MFGPQLTVDHKATNIGCFVSIDTYEHFLLQLKRKVVGNVIPLLTLQL